MKESGCLYMITACYSGCAIRPYPMFNINGRGDVIYKYIQCAIHIVFWTDIAGDKINPGFFYPMAEQQIFPSVDGYIICRFRFQPHG